MQFAPIIQAAVSHANVESITTVLMVLINAAQKPNQRSAAVGIA
jgi:hypothetical protein